MARQLSEAEALDALRTAVRAGGTAKVWAEQAGVTPQHLSEVLREKRGLGLRVAAALGLQPVTVYIEREAA